jgi:glycosyltransferase involved in cell wall biosynthesis
VGADEPGKNLTGIAAALEILRDREGLTPPWVIAGDRGRTWARLAARLSRTPLAGQVRHLGLVPAEDLPHLYRMAAVFLFPSLYEGFGLPVLEALSSGAPTITSRVSSLPEVAGRAALTVNPARPEEIARALRRVLRCPRLRALLSERGPIQAGRFSWEEAARETARAYRSALL